MESEIVNRVQSSSLVTFDLETLYQPQFDRVVFDLADYLHMGLILKEVDFRSALRALQWSSYRDKIVAIHCSADAIVPQWAYALVGTYLSGIAHFFAYGNLTEANGLYIIAQLQTIQFDKYRDAKVVLKGCGQYNIPMACYVEAIRLLMPHASSIMYGEPCSTVPLYKRPKA